MKLLLTMNLPYVPALGGANKANRALAEGFAQRGHQVRVVVPTLGTPSRLTYAQFRDALAAQNLDVISAGSIDMFTLDGVEVHAVADPARLRAHLTDQIRAFEPDWIAASSEDPSQNLLEAAVAARPGRVAYIVHTPTFLPFGPQAFFASPRRTKLLERVGVIVSVSRFQQQYIKTWSGLEADLVYMPAYGSGPFPNFGRFDEGFITLVNPCQVKGIAIFLELARALPALPFAAVPTWGTTDVDLAALRSLPNVTLLDPTPDFDRILARTRVILMPSLWQENFPLTVVESMLRGIPVLASDVGGMREAKLGTDFVLPVRPIEHFTDELDGNMLPKPIVPGQDIGPWRDTLRRLLAERALYERASAAARRAALQFVARLSVAPLEELLAHRMASPTAGNGRQVTLAAPVQTNDGDSSSKGNLEQLARLTPEQRALLVLRLRKKSG